MTREQANLFVSALKTMRDEATDNQALNAKHLYPTWSSCNSYTTGSRILYDDTLYRVLQDHTSQDSWTPDIAPALYTVVEVVHSGSQDDPIPYNGNMELVEGLYYTQDGVLYVCTRSTGAPVYNVLSELVGIYVEIVN